MQHSKYTSPSIPLLRNGEGKGDWETRIRPELERKWRRLMGQPRVSDHDAKVTLEAQTQQKGFSTKTYLRKSSGQIHQRVMILTPDNADALRPCAVVPFYRAELTAGLDGDSEDNTQFGRHLVERGFVVACLDAFPFHLAPDGNDEEPLFRWRVAAERLWREHPGWTGMGRLVLDTSRALDILLAEPGVDPTRTLIMGHSLGGKIALFAAACDARFRAVIGSDFGLRLSSTNWDAPWYFDSRLNDESEEALGEVLALLAPRPFLLIAGHTDGALSLPVLAAANSVYALYDNNTPTRAECFDHATGHRPSHDSLEFAYQWIKGIFKQ